MEERWGEEEEGAPDITSQRQTLTRTWMDSVISHDPEGGGGGYVIPQIDVQVGGGSQKSQKA